MAELICSSNDEMLSLDIIEPVSTLRRKLRQVTPSGGTYAIFSGQAA